MSWLFSQALAEEYLGDISLDGEQSAPLNGNPTQLAYCAPDKMTDFSRLSRFGMTYKPLTVSHGEDLLTLYLEDSLAKTSQQREKALDLMEPDQECGITWRGWLAKYDPNTFLWKTAQCSLLEDLNESLETLPRSGMTRSGLLWELPMLEQTTKGTEFGLSENWPTPRSCSAMAATITPESAWNEKRNPNLETIVGKRMWASPNARDWKDSGASEGNRKSPNLGTQVHWPTPTMQGLNGGSNSRKAAVSRGNWPTPRTKGMCGGSGSWDLLNKNTTIEEARQMGAGNGGKLNPDWVEWLMNWPIKWSDLNGFDKKEFERWKKASAAPLQESVQMRTVWWDRDPSQTSHRPQHEQQQEQQHCNSLHQVSWGTSCESTMERSHEGQDLSVLRESVHIQTSKRENLQSGVWEQTCMDEAQIVPRVDLAGIARVDRLKAIGNGQVPLCAATAWRLLSGL